MEFEGGVVESLKNKSILVTGSTGFLAKIFVEKVLRVQPNVKKLFLLVRAADPKLAVQRLHSEVTGKELFKVLKEKHGKGFQSFISDKLLPVAGDIVYEDLGIEDSSFKELMWREIDIVVNVAATTNFYERYDVALQINVLGAKNILEFAKKCEKLEMLLHVSTAYVAGERGGIILETPFSMGETLNENSTPLDIDAEVKLVEEKLNELQDQESVGDVQIKATMKELGLKRAKSFGWPNTYVFTKAMGEMLLGHQRGNLPLVIIRPTIITSIYKEPLPGWIEGARTIDSLIVGYANGKLTCFIGDPKSAMDVIPGDMVANAMVVSMVAHSNQHSEFIYHVSSSVSNPANFAILQDCGFRYFAENPRFGKDGKPIKTGEIPVFTTMDDFRGFMNLRYKLPLEGLRLVNAAFCRFFSKRYNELNRKYNFVMHLAGLYEPYAFFKGRFDDSNLVRLRMSLAAEVSADEANVFAFDPKAIDWEYYFSKIHIPGVLQYALK